MILRDRIALLGRLGAYILSDDSRWVAAKQKAFLQNSWFTPEFIEIAVENIARKFLTPDELTAWTAHYKIDDTRASPQKIGIVMAGDIPLVGFHDLLSVFISGHRAVIKTSSKDEVLIKELVEILKTWEPRVNP